MIPPFRLSCVYYGGLWYVPHLASLTLGWVCNIEKAASLILRCTAVPFAAGGKQYGSLGCTDPIVMVIQQPSNTPPTPEEATPTVVWSHIVGA